MFAIVPDLHRVCTACLALAIAARIFGSNAVLYGSGGTLTELFKRPSGDD